MLYILNTLVVPVNFAQHPNITVTFKLVTVEEARALLNSNPNFVSAVGHEATAQLLTKLLGVQIPFNRISVYLKPGDRCLHFFLRSRLPEGRVLTEDELQKLDFWLVLSEVQG